jgi:hypothetical protein
VAAAAAPEPTLGPGLAPTPERHARRARAQFDYLGETTEGNLHFVQRMQRSGVGDLFGLASLDDVVDADPGRLAGAVSVRGG